MLMQAQESQYKLKIGDTAPNFTNLPGVDGKSYDLNDFADKKALVVFWHCNHCPYSNAFESRLNQAAKDYGENVGFVGINSNDAINYPDDSFDNMKTHARENGLVFPYVYDEPQSVAKAYGAVCTPHVFVFDQQRRLQYQGRVDDHKDDAAKGGAKDLRQGIDAVLAGKKPDPATTRAFGCGVKWKPENLTVG